MISPGIVYIFFHKPLGFFYSKSITFTLGLRVTISFPFIEMKAKTGGFITTITRQSTEWEVFFTVKFHSFGNSTSDWQRILRITNNNGNKTSYGIRYPLVTMQIFMIIFRIDGR